ncbi:MAG: LacI family DNA-binding transcriptional regulator [Lachnospiraceae bacterium]|nr:LacI family DNA-binding transcriptional regulator [Lachnospiraceae bacterium]
MNLKDIAERAGVSTATVSNVINGNFHKVSAETRARIESIIKETNYHPNVVARSLAGTQNHMVGLVVPYISSMEEFTISPYYTYVVSALERYVRNHDYYLLLRCVPDVHSIVPFLSAWNIDGAIFIGVLGSDVAQIKKDFNAPAVFLDTYTDEKVVNVGIDDYRGGYLAARYLIGKGHRRIAFASPDPSVGGVIGERFRGFEDACREAGVDFSMADVYRTNTVYYNAIAVGQDVALSGKAYTAVAAMSDIVAMGIMEGIRQCGFTVPDDFSVIGFDNINEGAYVTPKLTTVEQDMKGKAELVGKYLLNMIETGEELAVNEKLPVCIKERESVKTIIG